MSKSESWITGGEAKKWFHILKGRKVYKSIFPRGMRTEKNGKKCENVDAKKPPFAMIESLGLRCTRSYRPRRARYLEFDRNSDAERQYGEERSFSIFLGNEILKMQRGGSLLKFEVNNNDFYLTYLWYYVWAFPMDRNARRLLSIRLLYLLNFSFAFLSVFLSVTRFCFFL